MYKNIFCLMCNNRHIDENKLVQKADLQGNLLNEYVNFYEKPHRTHYCIYCKQCFETEDKCVGV